MTRDMRTDGAKAAELLRAWANGDFDGFAESIDDIDRPGQAIVGELDRTEGDARGMVTDIAEELERLAALVRGAMYLARHAIDLAMDPPATRFLGRDEVLSELLRRK